MVCVCVCLQDKKGLSGKQNNFDRKAVYQRQVRAPSLLAKSILEGKAMQNYSFSLLNQILSEILIILAHVIFINR